jgi:chaperonin GroES
MPYPTPLFSKILVRRDPSETHQGKIELAESQRELKTTGEVVATGEGRLCPSFPTGSFDHDNPNFRCHVEPLRVRLGQRVLFSNYVQTSIVHEGEVLLVMDEDDVLCIL